MSNEPPRTFNKAMQELRTSWTDLCSALWAGYKEFLLTIGKYVVKIMDWMNE